MSVDGAYKFQVINAVRKKRVSIKLEDADGTDVDISEVIEQVMSYIKSQMTSDQSNVCSQQIFPLVTQILAHSLDKVVESKNFATLLISQEIFRFSFLQEMMVTFYFLKFIQKNKLNLITIEEDITQEEIEKLNKLDKLGAMSVAALGAGVPMQEVMKFVVKNGNMSREELLESGMFSEEDIDNVGLSDDTEKDN